jgi:YfiH family protein
MSFDGRSTLLASIPGIDHGFGSLAEPVPARLLAAWNAARPQWRQTHGVGLAETTAPGQACGEVDALWTRRPGGWVGAVSADCVPILMAARDGSAVSAIHAGWRGTYDCIVEAVWSQLRAAGQEPRNWVAATGPCIQPCCFEVGEDLQERFVSRFGTRFGSSEALNPRHRHLDLPWLNRQLLLSVGVAEVEIIRQCTRCARDANGEPLFHSYRREGGGTRQISVICRSGGRPG